jgi:polyisoprenyl-phosphate glycosyltransferase
LFYKLLRQFSEVSVDQQSGMFSLLDRKVVDQLKKCSEKNKYYVGLRFFMGFKQSKVYYDREKRFAGKPKQTFRRLLNYGLNACFSFSFLPIRILTYLGLFLLSAISILGLVFIIGRTTDISIIFFEQMRNLPGWTSIILAIFFVLGVQIIFLGVLGEYIARIFDEVRSRPYYVVEQVYKADNKVEED